MSSERRYADSSAFWNEDIVQDVSIFRHYASWATERSAETEGFVTDGSQEGQVIEGLEVKWGVGIWERFIEFGLETAVTFGVAQEVIDQEREDPRRRFSSSNESDVELDGKII